MVPMAERLGVDHQRLQQFITSSTWDHTAVRRRLAERAVGVVGADAWVVDDTGHVKDGLASPGVARQYTGTAGKVTNCQIAVSVHAVTDTCSAPMDWRLFLPESWDDTLAPDPVAAAEIIKRRKHCGVPNDQRHRRKWELVLDMLDEQALHGHTPPVLVGDAGYGDATEFRLGLTERGLSYVVAVKDTTSAYPGDATPVQPVYSGMGRPPRPRYDGDALTLRGLALAAGRRALRQVTWRQGTKKTKGNPTAKMRSRFLTMRVRPANRNISRAEDGSLPECWLLAEATRRTQAHRLLAVQPTCRHPDQDPSAAGQDPLADRARLPRTQDRPRADSLRGPLVDRLAPARHHGHRRPSLPHRTPPQ